MINVVTTVTAPAANYNLTDLATAKDELAIATTDASLDGFLSRGLVQISSAIANYCNRVFPVEGLTDTFYLGRDWRHQRMPKASVLQLTRWPVATVTSVTEIDASETQTVLAVSTDYVRNDRLGQLLRVSSDSGLPQAWLTPKIVVAYTAGYAAIPDDLVDAALRLLTARFRTKGRDPTLMSREMGPAQGIERYWVGGQPGQDGAFPPEIAGILDNYRVPVIG